MKVPQKISFRDDLHLRIFTLLNELWHWGVTPSDLKILATLYNRDFEMIITGSVADKKDRMNILFSSEVKKEMMEELEVSYNTFNNSLTRLRKKGIIQPNNELNEKLLLNLNKEEVNFTIGFQNER